MKKSYQTNISSVKVYANQIILLTFLGVVIVYIGVFYLSIKDEDFEPNAIGDTLGGVLSPLIGLISAILIYITIDQQIKANEKIQEQIAIQNTEPVYREVLNELDLIVSEIENIKFSRPNGEPILLNDYYGEMFDFVYFNEQSSEIGQWFLATPFPQSDKIESLYCSLLLRLVKILEFFSSVVDKENGYAKVIGLRISRISRYYTSTLVKDFIKEDEKDIFKKVCLKSLKASDILFVKRLFMALINIERKLDKGVDLIGHKSRILERIDLIVGYLNKKDDLESEYYSLNQPEDLGGDKEKALLISEKLDELYKEIKKRGFDLNCYW